MAILSGVQPNGEQAFYDIPDAELAKYKVQAAEMTDEVRARLFPSKDKMTKEDAQGVMPAAPKVGDVQGFAAVCLYWIYTGGWYYWWYDYC